MMRLLIVTALASTLLISAPTHARKAPPARKAPARAAKLADISVARAPTEATIPKPTPAKQARKAPVFKPPTARKHRTVSQRKNHETTRRADFLLSLAKAKSTAKAKAAAAAKNKKVAGDKNKNAASQNKKTATELAKDRSKQINQLVWILDNGSLDWAKPQAIVDRSGIDQHVKTLLLTLFDKNDDKLIDLRERYQLDRALWTIHAKQKRVLVTQFDTNGNGVLNPDEMITASNAHRSYINTVLKQFQLVKPKRDLRNVRTAGVTP
jgi:hypothetical protein